MWKCDIDNKVTFPGSNARLPTVLLCNKIDTAIGESKWQNPSFQDGINELEFDAVFATSALTGQGLEVALMDLVSDVMHKVAESAA